MSTDPKFEGASDIGLMDTSPDADAISILQRVRRRPAQAAGGEQQRRRRGSSMRLFPRIREYLKRRNDLNAGRDPVWDAPPEQVPTATMPAAVYEPHGIDTPETLAALREKAEADALAAQESAETAQWGEWDQPSEPAPLVPAHEPPPMPPSGLSRIMVAQIPAPQPGDLSYDAAHNMADYLRRIGVATGTSTDLEYTMAWGVPALKPGDGTGVQLTAQEHGETDPEVAA